MSIASCAVRSRHGSIASNATDVSRDLGRSRGSPVTSRTKRIRSTLTACSQSGAHQEAPSGMYIPGSRRKIGWLVCQARHLGSTASGGPGRARSRRSARGRLAARLHLRGERRDLCVNEAERLDVDHLGAAVLQRGARFAFLSRGSFDTLAWVLRCPCIVGSLDRRCLRTGGPLCQSCLAPTAALPRSHVLNSHLRVLG